MDTTPVSALFNEKLRQHTHNAWSVDPSLSARIKTGTCFSDPVIPLDTMISLDKRAVT